MLYYVFYYVGYLPTLLPRARLLMWRFFKYWLKDLWFYGSLLFALLFSVSSLLHKSADVDYASLSLENQEKIFYTSKQKVKNFDQLSAVLKVKGLSTEDRVAVLNLISGKFNNSVINDLDVDIEGEFDSQFGVYKMSSLTCKTKDLKFEILPVNVLKNEQNLLDNNIQNVDLSNNVQAQKTGVKYVLNVLAGDQCVKLTVKNVHSLRQLLTKIKVPFVIEQQCKKAYALHPFKFNNLPTYVIYDNPGKFLRDYKLRLLGHGSKMEQLQGAVLLTDKVKSGKRTKYVENFAHLGDKVSYNVKESISYVDAGVVGKYLHPLPAGLMTSGFGYRTRPRKSFHYGVDYSAPRGAPVRCALGGKVIMAQRYGAYGNVVIVSNGDTKTVYAHLHKINVPVGSVVSTGQIVGTVGSTGRSTGTHLHFEVRKNNKPVNPLLYIDQGKSVKKPIRSVKKEKIVLSESVNAARMKKELLAGLL